MTMITPSYLGETIEYSSLHACRSTLEDPTVSLVRVRNAQRELPEEKEFAPFCRDAFLADYRWPIAAGCIRRVICSTRETWGGAKGRTIPLPLET